MRDIIKKRPGVCFVIGKCYQTNNEILMRFQEKNRDAWYHTSSVPVRSTQVRGELNISSRMSGKFFDDPNCSGCPNCRSDSFAQCGCGKMFCWDSQIPIPANYTCPWCGINGELSEPIENIDGSRGG